MTSKPRSAIIAVAVWLFLGFWGVGFVGALFSAACGKAGLSPDQRLFRCGWAWTLSAPSRLLGDPAPRTALVQMTLAIAYADLGRDPDAISAFARSMTSVGLRPPFDPAQAVNDARDMTKAVLHRGMELAPGSRARGLFDAVAAGDLP